VTEPSCLPPGALRDWVERVRVAHRTARALRESVVTGGRVPHDSLAERAVDLLSVN
jgi:hypothetical protein